MMNNQQIIKSNKTNPTVEYGKRYRSKDYNLLNPYIFNRNLNDNNLKNIKENMAKNGFDYKTPIWVNEKYEILAGHHRFECAKELNVEFYYEFTTDTFEEIMERERDHKDWDIQDHIVKGSKIGDNQEEAQFIMELSQKFNLTLCHAKDFCTNFNNNKTENDKIRKGQLIIKNKEAILLFAEKYKAFMDTLERLGRKNFKFKKRWQIKAFQKLVNHPKFDMERFKQQLENYNSELHDGTDTENALEKYLYFYNYRRKNILEKKEFMNERGKVA